jgi:hypothetical protein
VMSVNTVVCTGYERVNSMLRLPFRTSRPKIRALWVDIATRIAYYGGLCFRHNQVVCRLLEVGLMGFRLRFFGV